MQEAIQGQNLKESIAMAFNLGVWMRQKKGHEGRVLEAAKELRDIIFWNISQQYSNTYPPEILEANVEYFLEIALLGYILPDICPPDEELKNKLIALIEAKARTTYKKDQDKQEQPTITSY
ncbi:MAG: hypothetical protein KatS3mg078_2138 [Deltaproteobacteria bacterium]|jgi:hypothetical protein|nr:MAG: hypothetical protein KatS3mg078_2138 [Deltaproteobacteria bacterium]